MPEPPHHLLPPRAAGPLARALAITAAAAAMAVALALAYRPLCTADLGYLLGYGDVFWKQGRVVETDDFIHPAQTAAAARGDDLPPGNYYDARGRFRLVNDKWLTEALLSAVHDLGGIRALVLLNVAIVAVLLALQAAILGRLKVSMAWLGPVWLATALGSYERFTLRPELLGYVCVLAHVWLLCGRITWRRVGAAAAVQVLAANVHSFWMLDLGVVLAFTADAALRAAWQKWRQGILDAERRTRLVRLAVGLALVAPAPMVSPGGWRTLLFPAQTLAALQRYHINGSTPDELSADWFSRTLHPWATIGEFYSPFIPNLLHTVATGAFVVLLAAAVVAGAVLLLNRRWALAAIVGAFAAIGLTMRRNIAPAAMVSWPLIALAAGLSWDFLLRRWRITERARRAVVAIVLAAVAGASACELARVVTNRFYVTERRDWRFAAGLCPVSVPLGACRWLDEHLPAPQPVFTDCDSSSNVVYFARKVTGVPVLTNTWATTFSRMAEVIDLCAARGDPASLAAWQMDVVVMKAWRLSIGLQRDPFPREQWALVFVEDGYVIYLRRTPANAPAITACELTPANLDVDAYIRHCRQSDPAPAFALKVGAGTLQSLGWLAPATQVWRACIAADPRGDFYEARLNLGVCLAQQGEQMLRSGTPGFSRLLVEARRLFQQALAIKPGDEDTQKDLRLVEQRLAGPSAGE